LGCEEEFPGEEKKVAKERVERWRRVGKVIASDSGNERTRSLSQSGKGKDFTRYRVEKPPNKVQGEGGNPKSEKGVEKPGSPLKRKRMDCIN